MATVSIILPVFNGEKFVATAVDSILSQSFADIELIAVNDCSTDGTADILARYAAKDSRVKIVTNASNEKLPKSLNNGFQVASGDLFTWTSDDNILKPECIERLVAGMEATGADIVYADAEEIDEEGNFLELRVRDHPLENLCFENTIGACFLYKKEVHIKNAGFKTDLFLLEDYDFWVRAWLGGFRFAHLSEAPYLYRRHGNSLSNAFVQRVSFLKLNYILRMLPAYAKERRLLHLAEKEISTLRSNFYYSVMPSAELGASVRNEPFNLYHHQALAEHLLLKGAHEDARKVVESALAAMPDWAAGHALNSFCHEMAGDLDGALACQMEAVARSRDPATIERLGKLKSRKAAAR